MRWATVHSDSLESNEMSESKKQKSITYQAKDMHYLG